MCHYGGYRGDARQSGLGDRPPLRRQATRPQIAPLGSRSAFAALPVPVVYRQWPTRRDRGERVAGLMA